MQALLNIARGFVMGSADVVPGVSGGTMALVLGIYERLVASIRMGGLVLGSLVQGRIEEAINRLRQVEWSLLVPLLAGILAAVVSLAAVLEHQLEVRPIQMAAIFLGLVVGSAVLAWDLIQRRRPIHLGIVLSVAVVVFLVLGVRSGTTEEAVGQLADPAWWALLGAGAVAIWAMILPGISGSFILVMLGMYAPVLAAVNDRDLGAIAFFAIGAVVGLALFSQLLYWALAHHHDTVMAALIGLMVGSLRVLWPWPGGVEATTLGAPDRFVLSSTLFAVAAFVVVIAVGRIAVTVGRSEMPADA